jgi:C-terminal processing protease CtpA/Prc
MRRTSLALGWLLCPAALVAAPVPASKPATTAPANEAQIQAAARDYAANLSAILDAVDQYYVRPVRRADLVEAALAGLYEAAGVATPGDLKERVKKAEKDDAVVPLLIKARADLGNVESLQGRKALLASGRALLRALDSFCTLATGEEAASTVNYDADFGLGIDLMEKSGPGPLVIKVVLPGGPAQRAGLRPGDRILAVDRTETKALSTVEGLLLLNGGSVDVDSFQKKGIPRAPGVDPDSVNSSNSPSPARLMVRSPGDKEGRAVNLVRGPFRTETVQGVVRRDDNSWDYWVDAKRRIAHVRVVTLARHTDAELARVLARLDDGGLRGLILDLRWCPGGYLASAVGVAGAFLEGGVVATTKTRGEGDRAYQAQEEGEHKSLRCPVVVLVNGETTGGGELIAAALQDHKRAAVAGQRTRGKGSIQSPVPRVALLREGGGFDGILDLRLTTGTFVRPNGKDLNRFADSKPSDDWGVRPDPELEFRASPGLSRRLKEWWQEQALRPGGSSQALPLDDPQQDPQRQAALKALLRLMGEKK